MNDTDVTMWWSDVIGMRGRKHNAFQTKHPVGSRSRALTGCWKEESRTSWLSVHHPFYIKGSDSCRLSTCWQQASGRRSPYGRKTPEKQEKIWIKEEWRYPPLIRRERKISSPFLNKWYIRERYSNNWKVRIFHTVSVWRVEMLYSYPGSTWKDPLLVNSNSSTKSPASPLSLLTVQL